MTLFEVAKEIARRLSSIFLRDANGKRPVYGGTKKFQEDPHWRDYILFYEYFHGDNGAGLGASHQTGWTALAVKLMENTIEHTGQSIQIPRHAESNASTICGATGAKRRRSASRAAVAV